MSDLLFSISSYGNNFHTIFQIWFHFEDCTVAQVGKSGANSKMISIANGFECPTTVDKNNWLNGESNVDKFSVAQNGRQVKVTRTDKNDEGWGMQLNFKCCLNEGMLFIKISR